MLVLGLESSTSSAKVVLYDSRRGVVDSAQQAYGPALERNGESDTAGVHELTASLAKRIAGGKDVAAVSVCGTWHSLAVCDAALRPVTPTFSWNFVKTAALCDDIRQNEELTARYYRNTGCMPHSTYPRHALMYLRKQGFALDDKQFITQGAYSFLRLTGEYLESRCTQSGTGLLNLERLDYDEFVLEQLGIRREQLAPLASYWDVRPLSTRGACELGLRAGIPVVPAHADGALNQIGSCANQKGMMTMSVGTSGAVRMATERPVLPAGRQLWCYYGVNTWITGAAVAGACNCIDWFVQAVMGGRLSYRELEQAADENADMPVFLPFLYGERCPGWNSQRRGGFQRVSGHCGAGALYKSIQMGILFNLFQCYTVMCRESGVPARLVLSGGIENSPQWVQMAADIFGRDVWVADYKNASGMGAVALALNAASLLDDIDAFRSGLASARRVACNMRRQEYYQRQYERYLLAYEGTMQ